jgi:hypothetical protein
MSNTKMYLRRMHAAIRQLCRPAVEPKQPPTHWLLMVLIPGKYGRVVNLATAFNVALSLRMCGAVSSRFLYAFMA